MYGFFKYSIRLHPEDISKLLGVLKSFLERGDTILMIEHDPTILRFADHVIHLEDGKLLESK